MDEPSFDPLAFERLAEPVQVARLRAFLGRMRGRRLPGGWRLVPDLQRKALDEILIRR